jgi:hypothetical protein
MEIHSITIQIARPVGNDPGTIEQSHYFVEKNVVVLCHRDGTPVTREGFVSAVGVVSRPRWCGGSASYVPMKIIRARRRSC